ncbi:UDP-glycosyltransferase 72E1-like [Pyrus ussuriensis x Pyrus communis]|uniref:UDP-glycosyltransferase 72E1-like n=1 Tax=Pyrus ussuriensis x Pyrus communis TaxID=2448454 RepID=A0A5N5G0Y6_9ROSA|nr:UDP-glycosyltransferase 72E1-like [Pyrus ussuriensis x Pyrus communis]
MESSQKKPHVTVLASPGIGHVTPLLELAKRLVVDHGFHVTFLSITTDAPPAQLQLLSNPSLPSDLHVVSLPRVDVSQQPIGISVRIFLVVQETLKSLPFVLKNLQPPIKSLVVDPLCIEALEIAADLSIPTYVFMTSSASLLAFTMYFPTINAEVNGDYSKIAEEVIVPGCKPLLLDDLVPGVLLPEVLPMCNRFPSVKGILVNTWEELEPVTLLSLRENLFFLGLPAPPDKPVTSTLESSKFLTWLDEQPIGSVVYVSFGSGGTLSREQMSELAWGLELSQKRFVWVARPPNDSSASGSFFKAGFLDRTRGRGLVTDSWAPQVAVLSHRSVAGFVTHCGWNSVLESVLHGVAMIAWPLYAEQRMNARFLVDVGVAVWPEAEEDDGKKVVGRCEVERVVRTILEEEGEG